MKPQLPFLELMLSSVCNLVCQGCSTYSDIPSRGYTPWSEIRSWLEQWQQKFDIEDIGPMGGEPLIYPDIMQLLRDVRAMFPNSKIRFPTNGLLLHKHWDVVDWLYQDGNATLKITAHLDHPELETSIQRVWSAYDWQPVHEYGIDRWRTETGLRFQINRPEIFTQTFRGTYETAQPWNSNPSAAFANCHQTTCPLLYHGRIYKCSTSALLPDALSRYGSPNKDQWDQYCDNNTNGSVGLENSAEDIQQFADNFGQPHMICRQCPTSQDDCYVPHSRLVKFR